VFVARVMGITKTDLLQEIHVVRAIFRK